MVAIGKEERPGRSFNRDSEEWAYVWGYGETGDVQSWREWERVKAISKCRRRTQGEPEQESLHGLLRGSLYDPMDWCRISLRPG